jgi:hypothetical protein
MIGGPGAGGFAFATPSPGATMIPDSFRLSHEGEAGFELRTDRLAPSALLPCRLDEPSAPDPTLLGRTDARTVIGPDGTGEQLLLFWDDSAASDAAYALSRDAEHCRWVFAQADAVAGGDRDVLYVQRLDGLAAPSGMVLHRGNALWILSGSVGDVHDVRTQLCQLLGLCVG